MQLGFYFDESRCIGCYTCVAACRSEHFLKQEEPDLIRVVTSEGGRFPHVTLSQIILTCFHCANPPCVEACPEGIFWKRPEDGAVLIKDMEQCTDCGLCVEACPYRAPQVISHQTIEIFKCDLCPSRRREGLRPACAAACPVAALEVAPLDDLIARHGDQRILPGFSSNPRVNPSILFRNQSLS